MQKRTSNKNKASPANKRAKPTVKSDAATQTASGDAADRQISAGDFSQIQARGQRATVPSQRCSNRRSRGEVQAVESTRDAASAGGSGLVVLSASEREPATKRARTQRGSQRDETEQIEVASHNCNCASPLSPFAFFLFVAAIFKALRMSREGESHEVMPKRLGGCCTACTNLAKRLAVTLFLTSKDVAPTFRDWRDLCLFMEENPARLRWGAELITQCPEFQRTTLVEFANKAALAATLNVGLVIGALLDAVHAVPGTKYFSAKAKRFSTASGSNKHELWMLRHVLLLAFTGEQSHDRPTRAKDKEPTGWQLAYRETATSDVNFNYRAALEAFPKKHGDFAFDAQRRQLRAAPIDRDQEISAEERRHAELLEQAEFDDGHRRVFAEVQPILRIVDDETLTAVLKGREFYSEAAVYATVVAVGGSQTDVAESKDQEDPVPPPTPAPPRSTPQIKIEPTDASLDAVLGDDSEFFEGLRALFPEMNSALSLSALDVAPMLGFADERDSDHDVVDPGAFFDLDEYASVFDHFDHTVDLYHPAEPERHTPEEVEVYC